MEPASFEYWLRQKGQRESLFYLLGAVGVVLLGTFVVYITFWIIYGVAWYGFNGLFPHSHSTRLVVSAVVLVLLFVGNATTDRRYLDKLEIEMDPVSRFERLAAVVTGYGWASVLSGPKAMHSFVKVLTSLLFVGPRLLTAAYHLSRTGLRLRTRDDDTCGRVLASLFAAGKRVAFVELLRQHPQLDSPAIIEQLHDVGGVLFLTSEPPGMSLGSELRQELAAWTGRSRGAME